jgi:hypothetical protein
LASSTLKPSTDRYTGVWLPRATAHYTGMQWVSRSGSTARIPAPMFAAVQGHLSKPAPAQHRCGGDVRGRHTCTAACIVMVHTAHVATANAQARQSNDRTTTGCILLSWLAQAHKHTTSQAQGEYSIFVGWTHTRGSGCGTPLGGAWWGVQGFEGLGAQSCLVESRTWFEGQNLTVSI